MIGEEALEQLALVGETPDLLVGCTGGGRWVGTGGGVAGGLHRRRQVGGWGWRSNDGSWRSCAPSWPFLPGPSEEALALHPLVPR